MDGAKVLVLGADGFIGRHLAFGLRAAGWQVVAHARRPSRLSAMGFATVQADLAARDARDPGFWRAAAPGTTHVVNAAGLLTGRAEILDAVHVAAPAAVAAAFPGATGLLVSAVGIDHADTDFARCRRAGEDVARAAGQTILRVGLVLADTSYGGSSLARALAALPLRTPVVGAGEQLFNPIHAADLSRVVDHLLRHPAPGDPVEIGGPQVVTQAQMVRALRAWLGLRPVPVLRLPVPLARGLGRLGDLMRLGPISATAVDQLQAGVLADTALAAQLPHPPRPFDRFLAARPAGTQDLWHARLYLIRPLLRVTLALLWLASGLVGLFLPADAFLPLLDGALPDAAAIALARAGGLADLAIAAALLRGWRPRLMAAVQAAMVLAYTLAFTALAPALWLAPLGGLLKNLPILALIALAAVLEEER